MDARHLRIIAAVLVCAFCGTATAAEPQPVSPAPAQSAAQPAQTSAASKTLFYRLLARKPAATIEDAIRAVYRYKGGENELHPLVEEMDYLDKNGIHFSKDIIKRKDDTLTIGGASRMLMNALNIKGGLLYRLFPDNQRYALREATRQGIVPPNSFIGQTMSGNDLMGMLVRLMEVSEYQKKKADYKSGQ